MTFFQPATDDERDQRILNIVQGLCQQLAISNYSPTFISWETADSRSRRGVEFPADDCLIEHRCVTLSAKMRGMLEPDEWKPIIASSLIFSKKLRKSIVEKVVVSVAPFVLLSVFLFVELPVLFPQLYTVTKSGSAQTSPLGYYLAYFLAPILTFVPSVLFSLMYARKARLAADRKAADTVGLESLLSTLNKIAELGVSRVNARQGYLGGPIPLLPGLKSRIANLRRYSNST